MKRLHAPPHLRVIEGGKKEDEPKQGGSPFGGRLPLAAYVLAAASIGVGTISAFVSSYSTQRSMPELPPAVLNPNGDRNWRPVGSASDNLEPLSNRRLIAKLSRDGGDIRPHQAIENNMASLLLEKRGAEAVPELETALALDSSALVREHAALILGRIGEKSSLPALRAAANSDADPGVRAAAAEAAGKIGK